MKMRVICYSKKKKMEGFCEAIANAQGCKWDKLPLAYPCDKERLTIFVASVPHEDLRRMVPEMTKERSANVAFLIDGAEGSAKEYIDAATQHFARNNMCRVSEKGPDVVSCVATHLFKRKHLCREMGKT